MHIPTIRGGLLNVSHCGDSVNNLPAREQTTNEASFGKVLN